MAHKHAPRRYTRPAKINKAFVDGGTEYGSPKPVRLDCWRCKRSTPHSNGKCNWCGASHEEGVDE